MSRDMSRTPSPDAFSFRPIAEEDNAPTEREIVVKNVAADQLSEKSEKLDDEECKKHEDDTLRSLFHSGSEHELVQINANFKRMKSILDDGNSVNYNSSVNSKKKITFGKLVTYKQKTEINKSN